MVTYDCENKCDDFFLKKKKWMLVLLSEGQSLAICKIYRPLFIPKIAFDKICDQISSN